MPVESQKGAINIRRCSVENRRALSLYKVYGDSVLLALNGTSLNSDSALLALNGTSLNSDSTLLALNWWYILEWIDALRHVFHFIFNKWYSSIVSYIHVLVDSCKVSYIHVLVDSCKVSYIHVLVDSCKVSYIHVLVDSCKVSYIHVLVDSCKVSYIHVLVDSCKVSYIHVLVDSCKVSYVHVLVDSCKVTYIPVLVDWFKQWLVSCAKENRMRAATMESCSKCDMNVWGWAEKFIGWLRRSCGTARKLDMNWIQPFLVLATLFPLR